MGGRVAVIEAPVVAGMVTFNPDLSDLEFSIPSILKQCDRMVIVDNGSDRVEEIEALVSKHSDLTLIKNNKNLGVAAALNQIFSWALDRRYAWVLTLDDDSRPPSTMMGEYRNLLESTKARVGIVCPLLENRQDGTVFHSRRSLDECITSGSLTKVEAWKAVGGFDEWLFIDGVDFDFSRRIVAAGYSIEECRSVLMPHQIGHSRTIHLLGKNPIIWNHSAFRQYYIQRNAIYIDYKLGTYSLWSSLRRFLKDLVFVLIWENDKLAKIRAMIRGWKAGMNRISKMRHP